VNQTVLDLEFCPFVSHYTVFPPVDRSATLPFLFASVFMPSGLLSGMSLVRRPRFLTMSSLGATSTPTKIKEVRSKAPVISYVKKGLSPAERGRLVRRM